MSVAELIVYLVFGIVGGLIGQKVAGRSVGGYAVTITCAFFGAFLGGAIARWVGAPEPLPITIAGHAMPIFWAVLGAAVATFIVTFHYRRVPASVGAR